ncbi:MAG: TetR/AcrR family transcriptional regulator [Pseudomonadota bacterium]
MTEKRSKKSQALRERLIDAAWRRIATVGLSGLTARELAAEANCALGSIYSAFDDLDQLAMYANLKSLGMLERCLVAAKTGRTGADALRSLGCAYARFAIENRLAWEALFDLRLLHPQPASADFVDAHSHLLSLITDALREIPVDTTPQDLSARSRTYFAAVHGIVSISLQGRFVGHPPERLEAEIDAFVTLLADGLAAEAGSARSPQQ